MNNMEIKVSVKDIPEVIEQLEIADKKINDLQQENKKLKKLCNKYEEEHKKEFNTWLQGQKVLKDLEEWLKNKIDNFDNGVKDTILHEQMTISIIYDYIQLLKEKYK